MHLFKSIKFTWWQVSIIKVCLLSLGISIGAYWADILSPYLRVFIVAFIVSAIYLIIVWAKAEE